VLTGLYPTIVSFQTINGLNFLLMREPGSEAFLTIHYLGSLLFIVYLMIIALYSSKAFRNNSLSRRLILLYIVVTGMFTVVLEIFVTYVWTMGNSPMDIQVIQKQVSGLPVSMVMAFTGFLLLIMGLIRNRQFTRIAGLFLVLLTAGKLIVYDQTMVSDTTRVILFFLAGTAFIGLSVGYRSLVRKFNKQQFKQHSGRKVPGKGPTGNSFSR